MAAPTMVSAAWWNPVSWFDGWSFLNKSDEKSEVLLLEEKIKTLESKIEKTQELEVSKPKESEKEISKQVEERVIYVEKPIYIETKKEEVIIPIPETVTNDKYKDFNIVYSYISQGTFSDEYIGEYGSILLGVRITTNKDIYIPKTTTDSSGTNKGFAYSVGGSEFVGRRSSEVKCGITTDGYCKIKAGSVEKELTVNVWIYPEKPGEYVLNFTKLGYKLYPDGIMKYADINKTGEPLYIDY